MAACTVFHMAGQSKLLRCQRCLRCATTCSCRPWGTASSASSRQAKGARRVPRMNTASRQAAGTSMLGHVALRGAQIFCHVPRISSPSWPSGTARPCRDTSAGHAAALSRLQDKLAASGEHYGPLQPGKPAFPAAFLNAHPGERRGMRSSDGLRQRAVISGDATCQCPGGSGSSICTLCVAAAAKALAAALILSCCTH